MSPFSTGHLLSSAESGSRVLRNLRRALVFLSILLAVFAAGFSWVSWHAELDRQTRQLEVMAEMGERALSAYLGNLHNALRIMGEDMRAADGGLDVKAADFQLKRFVKVYPELRIAIAASVDGQVLAASENPPGGPLPSLAAEPSFLLGREELQRGANLSVGRAFRGTLSGEWIIPVRHGLRGADGALRYVLGVGLPASATHAFWKDAPVPPGAVLGLIRDDLFVVSRYPNDHGIALDALFGKAQSGVLARHLEQQGFPHKGIVRGASSVSSLERVFAFHRLDDYAMTFLANVPISNVWAAWWRNVRVTYLMMLLWVAGSLAIFHWIRKQQQSWEMSRETRLRVAIDAAHVGIWERDLYTNALRWSDELKRLLGYSPGELKESHEDWFERLHPEDRQQAIARFREVRDGVLDRYEAEQRLRHRDGGYRTFLSRAVLVRGTGAAGRTLLGAAIDITARQEAEASQARLAAVAEGSGDAIYIRDMRGVIVYWNEAASRLYGYTSAEAMGRDNAFLIPAQRSEERKRNQERLRQGHAVPHHDTERVRKDGTLVEISVGVSLVRNVAGVGIGTATIARDITERKQSEAMRAQLAAIVESSSDAIYSRAFDGTILTWNAGAERMLGYTAAEAIGKPVAFVRPPERPSNAKTNDERLLRDEPVIHETTRLTKSGQVIHALATHSPIRDGGGKAIAVSIILKDITVLRQAQAATRDSEARFRTLVENSPYCIHELDLQGRFTSMNKAGLRMLNAADECSISGLDCLQVVAESDRARVGVSLARALGGEAAECEFAAINGCVFQTVFIPVFNAQGQLSRLMGLTQDVTSRRRAEEQRLLLEAQLRESQKMQAIGTLAGGIAHDFNNIIAIVLANVALMREDVEGIPHALAALDRIQQAGARARELVRQILSFSRRQATVRAPVSLSAVVEETVRLLRATLPVRVALELHCGEHVPKVLGDATQLQQALINLTTNALQAIAEGYGHISIGLDAAPPGDPFIAASQTMDGRARGRFARLTVSDSGKGMDAATRARIFEPFFTTKPPGEGTGLGLSVVHGIVQGHDGAITVQSEPGAGTTFTLYFPACEEKPDPPALAQADGGGAGRTGQPAPAGALHVLFIDDDNALLTTVQQLLERRGYRVTAHADATEAIRALRAAPGAFDLILTDYNMPLMSGLDVAREAAAIRPDLPVVVTSGFVDEKLQAQAASAGVREVLFKADSVVTFCDSVQQLARGMGGT